LLPTAQSTLYVLDGVLMPPSTNLLPPPTTAVQRDAPPALSVMQALQSDPQARSISKNMCSLCFPRWGLPLNVSIIECNGRRSRHHTASRCACSSPCFL
jgi:hypothetical protein